MTGIETGARTPVAHDTAHLLVIACIAFFATGMAAASIGPAIPDLASRTGTSAVAAGATLIALPAGGLTGQVLGGLFGGRIGRQRTMALGFAVFLIGSLGLAASPYLYLVLASGLFVGIGAGVLSLTGNVLAAEASTGAGPLNLVNAMFGLGAIVSPALIGGFMIFAGSGLAALWVIPGIVLCGLFLLIFWNPEAAERSGGGEQAARPLKDSMQANFRSPLLWLLCCFIFLYVALEASIAGWLSTILNRTTGMTLASGAMVTSWFFFMHTTARLGAAWGGTYATPKTLLRLSMVLCLGGAVLMILSAWLVSAPLAILAAAVLGVGIGPIMPSALATSRVFLPLDVGIATSIIMAAGTAGGVIVPWALGAAIFRFSATIGVLVLSSIPVVMILVLVTMERQIRSMSAPRGESEVLLQTK